MMKKWFYLLGTVTVFSLSAGENLWPGDGSFETSADFFDLPRDSREHYDGKYSLRVDPGKDCTSFRTFLLKKAGHKGYISFYLKTDRATKITYKSRSDNWSAHNTATKSAGKDWAHYILELPAENYNGGFELKIIPHDKKCTMWIDAVSYHADKAPGKYIPHDFEAGVSNPGKTGAILNISHDSVIHTIAAKNNTDRIEKIRLSATVEDASERKVSACYSKEIILRPGELFEDKVTILKKADRGYYVIRTKLETNGRVAAAQDQPFAIVDPPPPVRADSFAGIYFSNGIYGRNIGASWTRTLDHQQKVGPNGKIARTKESVMYLKTKYGMRQCRTLCIKRDPAQYPDWVLAMDKLCDGEMEYWGIAGEVDLTFPNAPEKYIRIVNELVPKIRAQHPGVKLSGCGVSGVDFNNGWTFTEPVIKEVGNKLDIIAPDPYTWMHYVDDAGADIGPEGSKTYERFLQLRNILNKYGSKADMWFGEVGWAPDVQADFLSETNRRAASYIPRLFVLGKAAGVKRIFYFLIHFCVDKERYNYGLWRSNKPLPGTAAYAAGVQALEFAVFSKLIANRDYHAFTFKREDGKMLACLWMSNRVKTKIRLNLPKDSEIRDMFWNPVKVKNGSWTISGEMSYLLASGISEAAFNKIVSAARVDMPPLKAEWKLDSSNAVILTLTNLRTVPLKGKFTVSGASFKKSAYQFELAPSATESYRLTAAESLNRKKISLKAFSNEGELTDGYYPLIYECPVWTRQQFESDKMPETGRLPDMTDRKYLLPNDPDNGWDGPDNLSVKSAIGHDPEYLYLRIDVRDSIHMQHNKPGRLWKQDCVQVAIDSRGNSALNQGYDKDDYEFGFALSNGKPVKELSYTFDTGRFDRILASVKLKVKREGKLTRYWIQIPLAQVRIDPENSHVFGFNFSVLDNDGLGIRYWMGPTSGICAGKNPGVFWKFILREK